MPPSSQQSLEQKCLYRARMTFSQLLMMVTDATLKLDYASVIFLQSTDYRQTDNLQWQYCTLYFFALRGGKIEILTD